MQFKIPQNVEIKDKILGPLSFRDLVIAGVGGGIAYTAYIGLDNQTWPIIAIPVVLLTLAIIFVKINNMSFSEWIYSLLLFIITPQKRVWKNMSDDAILLDLIINPKARELKNNNNKSQQQLIDQKQQALEKFKEIQKQMEETKAKQQE